MAQSSISVYRCDRCDRVDEIRNSHESYEWGKAQYFQFNGPKYNRHICSKTNVPEPDICPKCLNELHEWWMKGKVK
jgi:hypothetical protein